MNLFEESEKIGDWIPRRVLMRKLNYKPTQMAAFLKKYKHILEVSHIGRRVFIKESSVLKVLELNEV